MPEGMGPGPWPSRQPVPSCPSCRGNQHVVIPLPQARLALSLVRHLYPVPVASPLRDSKAHGAGGVNFLWIRKVRPRRTWPRVCSISSSVRSPLTGRIGARTNVGPLGELGTRDSGLTAVVISSPHGPSLPLRSILHARRGGPPDSQG